MEANDRQEATMFDTMTDHELDAEMTRIQDAIEAFSWWGGRVTQGDVPANLIDRQMDLLDEFDVRYSRIYA